MTGDPDLASIETPLLIERFRQHALLADAEIRLGRGFGRARRQLAAITRELRSRDTFIGTFRGLLSDVVSQVRDEAVIALARADQVRVTFVCPVCGYTGLYEEPRPRDAGSSDEICQSCGFQFGYSDLDQGFTVEQWRQIWVEAGMPWSSKGTIEPRGWNPRRQLEQLEYDDAGKIDVVRRSDVS